MFSIKMEMEKKDCHFAVDPTAKKIIRSFRKCGETKNKNEEFIQTIFEDMKKGNETSTEEKNED